MVWSESKRGGGVSSFSVCCGTADACNLRRDAFPLRSARCTSPARGLSPPSRACSDLSFLGVGRGEIGSAAGHQTCSWYGLRSVIHWSGSIGRFSWSCKRSIFPLMSSAVCYRSLVRCLASPQNSVFRTSRRVVPFLHFRNRPDLAQKYQSAALGNRHWLHSAFLIHQYHLG